MNDRRKSNRNGKEEYLREEVNGKRLDDWQDIRFALGSHSNRHNSGGTLDRLVGDGIAGVPPNVGFGTNNNQRYGIQLYQSGSTETYSKSSNDIRVVEYTFLFACLVWDCAIQI